MSQFFNWPIENFFKIKKGLFMKPSLLLLCAIAFCSFAIFSKTASARTFKPTKNICLTECRSDYKAALEAADVAFDLCTQFIENNYTVCMHLAKDDSDKINGCTTVYTSAESTCDGTLTDAGKSATEARLICRNNCSNENE